MNTLEISRRLFERLESKTNQVKHYYGLLAIYALILTAESNDDRELIDKCRFLLNKFPDEIVHGDGYKYNFPVYRMGGTPKSYMLYKGYMPEVAEQVRECAEEMMTVPRDPKGIVKRPHDQEKNLIWVDAVLPVTPYLLYAGLALNEQRYVDEATKQCVMMYEEFIDPENGLLHQCKNFVGPGKYSEDHWSRGNGWMLLALADLVLHLPKSSPYRERVENYFKGLCRSVLPYQSRRGLWRQEIPFLYSYEESSGTALILYGYGIGIRTGLLDRDTYYPAFEKGIRGLNRICINEDFSTENCCPICCCPGLGDEKGTLLAYITLRMPAKDELHGFGPVMLAMVEAYKNGIADLDPSEKEVEDN